MTGGLFVSMLLSLPYLSSPYPLPGRTAANMVRVQFLYAAWSMTVMALVAVSVWDALALDSRDTEILGPLPLARGVIVRAKVSALLLFAAGFARRPECDPRNDPSGVGCQQAPAEYAASRHAHRGSPHEHDGCRGFRVRRGPGTARAPACHPGNHSVPTDFRGGASGARRGARDHAVAHSSNVFQGRDAVAAGRPFRRVCCRRCGSWDCTT